MTPGLALAVAIALAPAQRPEAVAQRPEAVAQRPEAVAQRPEAVRTSREEQTTKEIQTLAVSGRVAESRAAVDRAVEGKPQAERVRVQVEAADALARLDDGEATREALRLYAVSVEALGTAGGRGGRAAGPGRGGGGRGGGAGAGQAVDADLQLRTRNNYAAVLLRTGQAREALEQLKTIDADMRRQPAPARARYLYNFGLAAEGTADPRQALQRYQDALAADPAFAEPARAASRLALAAPPSRGLQDSASLVDAMMAGGLVDAAGEHLRQACLVPAWAGAPDYSTLVASIARYLAAAKVEPAEFAEVWIEPLGAAARGGSRQVQRRYADLQWAYADDRTERVFRTDQARDRFAHWLDADADAAAFVTFLNERGRQLRVADRPAAALDRLGAAWALSRVAGRLAADAGMAAAVDLADLLLASGRELDAAPLLDELIAQLFEGKGRAYEGRDYANALRFHLLLGSIFEQQERWGPASEPRSALFQWQMAIRDHEALRRSGESGDLAEVPGLHLRLARAWRAVKNPRAAFDELLLAAEGFLVLGRHEEARGALARARDGVASAGPGGAQRLRALEARLPKLP